MLEPSPEEQKIIAQILALRAKGVTVRGVIEKLTASGMMLLAVPRGGVARFAGIRFAL